MGIGYLMLLDVVLGGEPQDLFATKVRVCPSECGLKGIKEYRRRYDENGSRKKRLAFPRGL